MNKYQKVDSDANSEKTDDISFNSSSLLISEQSSEISESDNITVEENVEMVN